MILRHLFNGLTCTLAMQNLTTLRWDEYQLDFEDTDNGKPGMKYVVISRRNGATGSWVVLWKLDVTIVEECLQRFAGERAKVLVPRRESRGAERLFDA